MGTLLQDLRFSLRTLRRNPGYAVVTVLTLALGIGATTAIFSVLYAVVLRPLPFPDPERLVLIWEARSDGIDQADVRAANFLDWRSRSTSFEGIAILEMKKATFLAGEEPEQAPAALVSRGFFELLDVSPHRGRTFVAEEEGPESSPVVVLSHGLWQRRFGGEEAVLGSTLSVESRPHTVIGILPEDFRFDFAGDRDLWLPKVFDTATVNDRTTFLYKVLARLRPGVTIERAQEEMDRIARDLEEQFPDSNTSWSSNVTSLHEELVGSVRPALFFLFGTVGFVLLVACANVTLILLARSSARAREIALRKALGAGRVRLGRQLLTETALLALVGGAAGLALAALGVKLLLAHQAPDLPRIQGIEMDTSVLAVNFALSVLAGAIFGALPALKAARVAPQVFLKEGGARLAGKAGRFQVSNLLVVLEVAMVMVLLIGTGLMAKSFYKLLHVELGFDTERRIALEVSLPASDYPDSVSVAAFFQRARDHLAALPGVRAVGTNTNLPLAKDFWASTFYPEGRPIPEPAQRPFADMDVVSPGYFEAMGIRLLRGRTFDSRDQAGSQRAALINQTMAERVWPGEDPLGTRMRFLPDGDFWTIVGIVGDVQRKPLEIEPRDQMYMTDSQITFTWPARQLVLRTDLEDPMSLVPAIRREILALDDNLPIGDVRTLEEHAARSISQPRFHTVSITIFGAVALALGLIGIYGVVSYFVSQRTQEFGIRKALGADRSSLLRAVVGREMVPVLVGVVVGVGAALLLGRVIRSVLYQVSATDPIVFAGLAVLLLGVAVVAVYLPARQATRVDPVRLLRG